MKETDCHVPALIYKGQGLYEGSHTGESYEINDEATIAAATKEMAV